MRRQAVPGSVLRVLEAGCGREWYFELKGIPVEITGVDLDPEAIRLRLNDKKDLSHAIVGDLRTLDLTPNSFDIIYNSFVLEHVDGAQRVLENFVRWLRPGGLLIIRVPDLSGVQAFVAGHIPHWCSVMYYRIVLGMNDAGKPGFAPYPTVYDDVISRSGLHKFCAMHELSIVDELGVGTYGARGRRVFRVTIPLLARLIRWVTLGNIHDRYIDLTLVARKAY